MANRFRQFRLLLWKNFILQYRRPIGTVFEIVLPVLLVCVLILPKVFIKTEEHCFSTFKPLESIKIKSDLLESAKKYVEKKIREDVNFDKSQLNSTLMGLSTLAYYPNNDAVKQLMMKVAPTVGMKPETKSWGSAAEMADEVSQRENDFLGAIEFYNVENGPLPKVVKYAIRLPHELAENRGRWRTSETYPPFQAVGPRISSSYTPVFIALQYAVDMAILQEQSSDIKKAIPLNLQQLPYPEYTQDLFLSVTEGLMPLLLTLAFLYSASSIVKELVNEKHERLKESMKMMGLANWVHWLAWFTKNFIFLLISVIIITGVLKGLKIYEYSDGLVVFIFFALYAIASISFCFCISVFFSRPTLAMLCTMVLWYCSYVPFEQIQQRQLYETLSRSQKAAACLLPNTCLGFASKVFAKFESRRLGVTWDHVSSSPSPDDDFSMAWVFMMLILQSLMYGVLTWYIEGVFPGKYGLPLPFYFPFKRSYWCGYSQENTAIADAGPQEMNDLDDEKKADVEEENHSLPVGVAIKNLRKVFKGSTGSKVAVDGLTLNIFENQITALLGHNGAGKTTTMSVLTGLFPPTSGSGHVDGKSILTDMAAIRESLGLCPQHNVLFDRLSVKEHLEFFINLKGKFGPEAETEVLQMVNDIQLTDKLHWLSSKLSGGMKRKLSCAIALVGGSKTVFLDEPTSGMDPYARRATWDLLLKHKTGRTIILTTHFMDEADFLGDRIAIMADGQLRCCGSSLFLKSRYGVGYHLTLVKKDDCDANAVTRVVMGHIPSAQLLSSIGAELEFVLSGEDSSNFEPLFLDLENKLEQYGITSFGVSCTTMEEVFMKVGEGSDKTVEDAIRDQEHLVSGQEGQQIVQVAGAEQMDLGELNTGLSLKLQQYKAMFMKRFLNSRREKKALITQMVLPMVMVLFGLLLLTTVAPFEDDPPRLLRLSNLSVDGVASKAFYADFRDVPSGNRSSAAKDYLKTVKVDTVDVTSNVNKIQSKNEGTGIYVKGTAHEYKSDGRGVCCKYQYLILNENCKKSFLEGALNASDCDNDEFGYKDCSHCLVGKKEKDDKDDKDDGDEEDKCKPFSCNATNLEDMNTYFMEYVLENSDSKDYFNEYVAGFVFGDGVQQPKPNANVSSPAVNGTPTTLWYSNEAFHTIAEALSALSNILLQEENGDSYGIEATNHPLPRNAKNQSENVSSDFSALLLAIFLAMGMAFMAASFITFLVQERRSKAKHLQFVSGVDALSFWFATFTWDFVNYLVPMFAIFIMFIAFQVDSFNDDLGTLLLLLLLFGVNVLPFVYALSFIFTSPLIAYALTVFILSIVSMVMLITVFICQIPAVGLKEEADIMHYVFMLLPTYTISYALVDMDQNYGFKKTCTSSDQAGLTCAFRGVKYADHYLDWERPGVGQPALYMALEALVLFILTVLIEVRFFMKARVQVTHGNFDPERKPNEDEDVFTERKRIYNMEYADIQNEAVVMNDLTKVYPGTAVTAVDHLCLGIPRGACFGLLGINGAGKTTTFGMLTGDLSISEGTAYMGGYNLQSHLKQFDALIERLTGREMLTMYANLRGVPSNKIKDVVSSTIDHLHLRKWADKLCGDYSGGNKRKLSTAIALVGNPPIIFLDEPTTGMDPVARRYLWDSLMSVLKGGRSIVLTSHSMEECEALCSRLAIMVNGQFKCLGSIQHLKSRFGRGYTMMIKVAAAAPASLAGVNPAVFPPQTANGGHAPVSLVYSNPVATDNLPDVNEPPKGQVPEHSQSSLSSRDVHATIPPAPPGHSQPSLLQYPVMTNPMDSAVINVQRFVAETFRGAQLLESHNGMLHYHLDDEGLTWSFIFGQIERNRQKLNVVDYSVSQTSLDQVFINFAKEQHSEERTQTRKKCSCSCF